MNTKYCNTEYLPCPFLTLQVPCITTLEAALMDLCNLHGRMVISLKDDQYIMPFLKGFTVLGNILVIYQSPAPFIFSVEEALFRERRSRKRHSWERVIAQWGPGLHEELGISQYQEISSYSHAWQSQGELSQEGDSRKRTHTTVTVWNLRPSYYTLRNNHKQQQHSKHN